MPARIPARPLAGLAMLLAGCAADPAAHVPPFARDPYQQFSRDAAVAIALAEWRAFGAPVDDDAPGTRTPPAPDAKPERMEGLWQRVGLYWWLGLDAGARPGRWTGKHDAAGHVFPADEDERFAWSAAFVSYVMRLAGAGDRFPYGPAHNRYINIAVTGDAARWAVAAAAPDAYAPVAGDLICFSRTPRPLVFADLPAGRFPAHCDLVVGTEPGLLDVVGGDVDDAVTLKHVPVTPAGLLADARYPWFVVVRVLYAD